MGGDGSGRKAQVADVGPEDSSMPENIDILPLHEAITGFLELEKDTITYIYRIWPENPDMPSRQPRYVGKYIGPVDIEDIKNKCGGGVYRAQIRLYVGGKRSDKDFKAFNFAIDGPPKMAKPTPDETPPPAQDEIIKRMDKLENMIISFVAKGSDNRSGSSSTLEKLEEIKLMKEILSSDGGNNLESMIGLFTNGVNLAKKLGGGSDSNWADVLKELAPKVLEVLKPPQKFIVPRGARRRVDQTAITTENAPAAETVQAGPIAESEKNVGENIVEILAGIVSEGIEKNFSPESITGVINRLLSEDEFNQIVNLGDTERDLFCKTYLSDKPTAREYIDKLIEILKQEELW